MDSGAGSIMGEDTRTDEEKKKSQELANSIITSGPGAFDNTFTIQSTPITDPNVRAATQGFDPVYGSTNFRPVEAGTADITGALAKYGEAEALYENPFLMANVSDMAMPTAFSNPLEYSSFRKGQQDLVQMLQDRAAGKTPSVAEEMLKAQHDRAINQQMALAASQSGRGMPATQRQLMQQAAMGAQELGRQGSIARLQEQLAAQSALSQALQQGRAGDQGFQSLQLRQGEGQADINKANMLKNLEVNKSNLASQNLNRQGLADAIAKGGDLMGEKELAELAAKIEADKTNALQNSPIEWMKALGSLI